MKIEPMSLPDVLLITPDVFHDSRGFFMEAWNATRYSEHGLDVPFVQDNRSRSNKGVLRGLHYQLNRPQGKLVGVVSGAVFDVVVDIRKESATFGKWVGAILSDENFQQMYVPPGFAHGFCVVTDHADFCYKCTDFYDPADEYGIRWDDPDINIDWPKVNYLISEKDLMNPFLADARESLPNFFRRT